MTKQELLELQKSIQALLNKFPTPESSESIIQSPIQDCKVNPPSDSLDLFKDLFTEKQIALIQKKLDGVPFSKTEGEYYSRVIKKRLKILSQEGIQPLAKKILEK